MSDLIKHTDQTGAVVDDPDADVKLSWWNKEHEITGGNHGGLLMRDTAASDGGNWLQSVVIGKVLASQGAGTAPAYTSRPALEGIQFPLTNPASPGDGLMWPVATGTVTNATITVYLQVFGKSFPVLYFPNVDLSAL